MKSFMFGLIISSLAASHVMAEDVKFETRSRTTGKKVVLFTSDCAINQQAYTGADNSVTYKNQSYKITYQLCEEKVNYEVKITGSFWDSEEVAIPNSESQAYVESSTKTKTFYGSSSYGPTKTVEGALLEVGGLLSSKRQCEQQKDILDQQARLDRQSKLFQKCVSQ